MDSLKERIIKLAATGFGSGLLPRAPGTAGTCVAVPLVFLMSRCSWPFVLSFLLAFTFLAVYLAGQAEILYAAKDAPCIVIDEVAGFLWTMFVIPVTLKSVIFGFIFFRFFDIVKPFPIGSIQDRLPGGYGIVGDDVMAGIYGNLALRILMRCAVI